MLRIVVLSCLLAGISGLGLDLRIGLAQPGPEVTTIVAPSDDVFVPVPNITEAKASQGASDNKYFLYPIKLNWFQAMELCFQMGQRLATFDTEVEYKQLVGLLQRTHGNNLDANYWTAGSDLGEWGKYVWMSTGKALNYVSWYPGEPNHGGSDVKEHCIDIIAQYHYRMNDNHCTKAQYVVCEAVH